MDEIDSTAGGNKSRRLRASLITGACFVIYAVAFIFIQPRLGLSVGAVAAAPVAAAALCCGLRAGLVAAILVMPLNALLFSYVGADWHVVFSLRALPGNIMVLFVGALVGWLHDLRARLANELEERRAAEIKAQESERRFRAMLKHAPSIITMARRDGKILFVNSEAYPEPDSGQGRSIFDFLPPEGHAAVRESLEQVFEKAEVIEREDTIDMPNGSTARFRSRYGPVFEGDEVTAVVIVSSDITNLKRLEDIRSRFVESIVAAQEDERRRIARELHDVTAQSLTSLLISLRVMCELPDAETMRVRAVALRELTAKTLDDIGRLARGLHPSVLDDVGFAAALERHSQEFHKTHGIETDLEIVGLGIEPRLPAAVETTLFRIAQEALTNVARHAEAKTVSLIVERKNGTVRAIIEDDGCGFVVDEETGMPKVTGGTGLGLQGIRERAELVGGDLTIESAIGAGTTLYVTIPIEENEVSRPT